MNQVDTTLDFYKKGTLLDSFFERNIQPFQEHQLIEAINLIFKEDFTILEISEVLRINQKTMLRIFSTSTLTAHQKKIGEKPKLGKQKF